MPRFLLVLTVISVAGWSQPAQQQAQPPIVVKVDIPPTPNRDFIGFLQALGPLTAALVAVGVGTMQWHIQKQNLKQQRFAKRLEVYSSVRRFLPVVSNRQAAFSPEEYDSFLSSIGPAKFLFGTDVSDLIAEITDPEWIAVPLAGLRGPELRWLRQHGPDGEGDPQTVFEYLETRVESAFGRYLRLPPDHGWIEQCIALADRCMDRLETLLKSRYND